VSDRCPSQLVRQQAHGIDSGGKPIPCSAPSDRAISDSEQRQTAAVARNQIALRATADHAWGVLIIGPTGHPTCNVRFGSLADISQCNRHVRFTPESGHSGKRQGCPPVVQSCPLLLWGHRSDGERTLLSIYA
jgi:hypothetical protein